MAGRVAVAVRVDGPGEPGRADPGLAGEHRQHRALGFEADRRRRGTARSGCRSRSRPPPGSRRRRAGPAGTRPSRDFGKRQALAHLDRRGLVRDADREQLAHRGCAPAGMARARSARRHASPGALPARLELRSQFRELALGAALAHRHDRDVESTTARNTMYAPATYLTRLVQRQLGRGRGCGKQHAHDGAALRRSGAMSSSPSSIAPQPARLDARRPWRPSRTSSALRTAARCRARQT